MKYLFVVLIPLFFAGCVINYEPNYRSNSELRLYNLIWTLDGNHILVFSDTTRINNASLNEIRDYDKNGALLRSYPFYYGANSTQVIWPTADDSTCFFSGRLSLGGDYTLYRFFLASGSYTPIAGGSIIAESPDANHLFVGTGSYQYSNTNNFLVVDARGTKPRLENSWYDPTNLNSGVWMGSNNLGYFRNNSLNLVDFVITDTTGAKLDSFDVSGLSNSYGIRVFHGPGALYFSTAGGILKYDSATKKTSILVQDLLNSSDISPDGSFIVYVIDDLGTPGPLMVINTKTGASKVLATTAQYSIERDLKVSPLGNQVAFIDNSKSSGGKLTIIPVSAP